MILAVFFVLAAVAAFVALALVDVRTVPRLSGTAAAVVTLAALVVAARH
ncbi:hypothetical protein AB0H51_11435 [Streptomyces griseoluteus]